MNRWRTAFAMAVLCALATPEFLYAAGASMGGFIPFVGLGLTSETKPNNSDTFFLADAEESVLLTGSEHFLGPGANAANVPFFDLAIFDTGGAAHILTRDAHVAFDIQAEGFQYSPRKTFPIGTANGIVTLDLNKSLGVYVAGLGDKISAGATLQMDTSAMRGQTTVVTLSAPSIGWSLPNIVGLPMAAHHKISILNSDPQILQHHNRTVRTPQIELGDIGTGGGNISRRVPMKILPGESFITGPLYIYTLSTSTFELEPVSPTVVPNGGLFLEVDMANGTDDIDDKDFLFDTGADLTVISELTASRLGFHVGEDTPDFFLEVNTPAGISGGVPGIFIDELNIDAVGGRFKLTNVPVAILDLPNPNQPGNLLNGIIGMNLFNDRDIVIDTEPAIGQGGHGPSLYISDPVTQSHSWATAAASGDWAIGPNWNAAGTPGELWVAKAANFSGSNQTAVVSANGDAVHQLLVSGTPTATMTVKVNSGVTLTTFQETRIESGGRIELAGGKLDTLFLNIEGGVLTGTGTILAGTGPIENPVRNLSGRVEPGAPIGTLTIDGDFSQQSGGTLAVDLAGASAEQYDLLDIDSSAFLGGTLEINLLGYTPAVNAEFTILTTDDGVFGHFANIVEPNGFDFDVEYTATDVILTFIGSSVTADYDHNGTVDAADYVVWRHGTAASEGYTAWQSEFGDSQEGGGSASAAQTGVPEPTAAVLMLVAACGLASCRQRCYSARSVRNVDEL